MYLCVSCTSGFGACEISRRGCNSEGVAVFVSWANGDTSTCDGGTISFYIVFWPRKVLGPDLIRWKMREFAACNYITGVFLAGF